MTATIGVAVFALIAVGVVGLEAVARRSGHPHATMTEVGRWLRSHRVMRWALLISWGFVGWHFFVQ
ncbi:MAG TPA: hypothetical protein VHI95_19200 [Acidimicrobiales bacterium]|jgi:hypothetical protein|nr:hypothetical protein [Acidimicrobiales bacterium]